MPPEYTALVALLQQRIQAIAPLGYIKLGVEPSFVELHCLTAPALIACGFDIIEPPDWLQQTMSLADWFKYLTGSDIKTNIENPFTGEGKAALAYLGMLQCLKYGFAVPVTATGEVLAGYVAAKTYYLQTDFDYTSVADSMQRDANLINTLAMQVI